MLQFSFRILFACHQMLKFQADFQRLKYYETPKFLSVHFVINLKFQGVGDLTFENILFADNEKRIKISKITREWTKKFRLSKKGKP